MRRLIAFVLVLLVTVVLNGIALALVFSRGVAFSWSVTGLAIQLPLVVVMGVACAGVLVKVRRMTATEAGFAGSSLLRRSAAELTAGMAFAALVLMGVAGVVVAMGAALPASKAAPSLTHALVALVACTVNAAFQQIALQSMALAASGSSRRSEVLAVVGACAFFALTHAVESTAPVFLMNVLMFALLTSLLFFGVRGRGATAHKSYAAAIGFHAGWNFTRTSILGAPFAEGAPDTASAATTSAGLLTWPLEPALVTGGVHGPDGGVACLVILAIALATTALVFRRSRR